MIRSMASGSEKEKDDDNIIEIPVTLISDTHRNRSGWRKTCAGLDVVEWIFVCLAFLNILCTAAVTSNELYHRVENFPGQVGFTFSILLLVNIVFSFMYLVHAVHREKEFEIVAFMVSSILILVYCIIEFAVNSYHRSTFKLVRLIANCVAVPICFLFGIVLTRRYNWRELKIVGASEDMQYMFKEAARFTSLLKFDFQVALSFLILLLRHGSEATTIELIIISVGVIVSLLFCFFGWFSMRKELKFGVIVFALIGLMGPAYVIFYILWIYNVVDDGPREISLTRTMNIATCIAGAIFLLVRCLVYVMLYRVSRNFYQGLKERAFDVDERTSLLSLPSKR